MDFVLVGSHGCLLRAYQTFELAKGPGLRELPFVISDRFGLDSLREGLGLLFQGMYLSDLNGIDAEEQH